MPTVKRLLSFFPSPSVRRQLAFLAWAALGWLVVWSWPEAKPFIGSEAYVVTATALLALGLFASTVSIDVPALRDERRTVLLAVSLGVVAKAAIIAIGMYLFFGFRPEYLVLGVAVAQIDPLSIAAMQQRHRLSERARSLLAAWASFDDPVTVLLAIYLTTLTLHAQGHSGPSSLPAASGLITDLAHNAALVALAGLIWWVLRDRSDRSDRSDRRGSTWWRPPAQLAALVALGAYSVYDSLLLGFAVTGLFFRPRVLTRLNIVVTAAFYLAALGIGMVLVTGVSLGPGLVLGIFAFCAQIAVALLLLWPPRGDRSRADIGYLALGQQNGITAVILALVLEVNIPGSVAVIAPAILVVNLLHLSSNASFERWVHARSPG